MSGRDRITPEGKTFFKQIEELKKLQVRVGFQHKAESGEDSGADLVDIAMWNELGTEHSPPRPFLRQSVEKNKGLIDAACKETLEGVVRGKLTAEKALQTIGEMQKELVQAEIKTGGFTPNAPITIKGGWMSRGGKAFYIKGKKSKQPLIDSGHMRQSVSFVITGKGDD